MHSCGTGYFSPTNKRQIWIHIHEVLVQCECCHADMDTLYRATKPGLTEQSRCIQLFILSLKILNTTFPVTWDFFHCRNGMWMSLCWFSPAWNLYPVLQPLLSSILFCDLTVLLYLIVILSIFFTEVQNSLVLQVLQYRIEDYYIRTGGNKT